MPSNQIYLYPQDSTGVWIAEHLGPHAQRVRELFGTVRLPTPFQLPIQGPGVVAAIKNLNPGVYVDYFDSEAQWREDCRANGGPALEVMK